MIKINETAKISPNCDIEDSTRGSLIEIGADSTIDSFVKFKPAGGKGDIKIGKRVYINSCCVLYSGNGISIGDDVLISAIVLLLLLIMNIQIGQKRYLAKAMLVVKVE